MALAKKGGWWLDRLKDKYKCALMKIVKNVSLFTNSSKFYGDYLKTLRNKIQEIFKIKNVSDRKFLSPPLNSRLELLRLADYVTKCLT